MNRIIKKIKEALGIKADSNRDNKPIDHEHDYSYGREVGGGWSQGDNDNWTSML